MLSNGTTITPNPMSLFPDKAVLVGPFKLKKLLDSGASVHEKDKKGRTALFRVCRSGHTDKAALLLEAGVSGGRKVRRVALEK
jgi:ankyrin repeat protein